MAEMACCCAGSAFAGPFEDHPVGLHATIEKRVCRSPQVEAEPSIQLVAPTPDDLGTRSLQILGPGLARQVVAVPIVVDRQHVKRGLGHRTFNSRSYARLLRLPSPLSHAHDLAHACAERVLASQACYVRYRPDQRQISPHIERRSCRRRHALWVGIRQRD